MKSKIQNAEKIYEEYVVSRLDWWSNSLKKGFSSKICKNAINSWKRLINNK